MQSESEQDCGGGGGRPVVEQDEADEKAAEDGADDIAEIEIADLFSSLVVRADGGVGEQGKSSAQEGGGNLNQPEGAAVIDGQDQEGDGGREQISDDGAGEDDDGGGAEGSGGIVSEAVFAGTVDEVGSAGDAEKIEAEHGSKGRSSSAADEGVDAVPENLKGKRDKAGTAGENHGGGKRDDGGERAGFGNGGGGRGLRIAGGSGDEERDGADDEIAGRGYVDGFGFSHGAHEERGGGQACDSGAEGIDGIERADGLADVGGAAHEVLSEKGQSAAHEQGGDEEEQEGDGSGDGGGAAGGELGGPVEEMEGAESEEADGTLDGAEGAQRGETRQGGKTAASEAAEAQSEHETRNNDGYRFNIDAVDSKQGSLPNNLIEESGKAGDEEEQIIGQMQSAGDALSAHAVSRGIRAGAHKCFSC